MAFSSHTLFPTLSCLSCTLFPLVLFICRTYPALSSSSPSRTVLIGSNSKSGTITFNQASRPSLSAGKGEMNPCVSRHATLSFDLEDLICYSSWVSGVTAKEHDIAARSRPLNRDCSFLIVFCCRCSWATRSGWPTALNLPWSCSNNLCSAKSLVQGQSLRSISHLGWVARGVNVLFCDSSCLLFQSSQFIHIYDRDMNQVPKDAG